MRYCWAKWGTKIVDRRCQFEYEGELLQQNTNGDHRFWFTRRNQKCLKTKCWKSKFSVLLTATPRTPSASKNQKKKPHCTLVRERERERERERGRQEGDRNRGFSYRVIGCSLSPIQLCCTVQHTDTHQRGHIYTCHLVEILV